MESNDSPEIPERGGGDIRNPPASLRASAEERYSNNNNPHTINISTHPW